MDFTKACELAYKHFERTKKMKGIESILDAGDIWIVSGRDLPLDTVQYGNEPIAIDKKTGDAYYFSISENFDKYFSAKEIEVPEQYRLQVN